MLFFLPGVLVLQWCNWSVCCTSGFATSIQVLLLPVLLLLLLHFPFLLPLVQTVTCVPHSSVPPPPPPPAPQPPHPIHHCLQAGKVRKHVSEQEKAEEGLGPNVKSIVTMLMLMLLMMFAVHCTWVTSNAYSSPSVVLASYNHDG